MSVVEEMRSSSLAMNADFALLKIENALNDISYKLLNYADLADNAATGFATVEVSAARRIEREVPTA
ncbi:hypothetical protein JK358_37600 [Nocardia sp. 2]|uniref:Uncharacterized protein n=1 Tax=Nocardia acididurans TaxID=2802282 RepID=A0ABS1MJ98_9NOCA|nr:hypothetical protein [Nocardia acididurans]MBL1080125.1 hypothetical protein [Nocardia acididurans]